MNGVKKLFLLAFAIFSFLCVSCVQEESVEEVVVSSVSGGVRLENQALEGSSVLLVKVKSVEEKTFLPDFSASFPSATTDSAGLYKFNNVSPGFYKVFAFSSLEEGSCL